VVAYVEHAPLVRAVARVAYGEGARLVDAFLTSIREYGASAQHRRPTTRSGGRRTGSSSASTRKWGGEPPSVNIVGEPDPDLFSAPLPRRRAGASSPAPTRPRRRRLCCALAPYSRIEVEGVDETGALAVRHPGDRADERRVARRTRPPSRSWLCSTLTPTRRASLAIRRARRRERPRTPPRPRCRGRYLESADGRRGRHADTGARARADGLGRAR